ncbi:hypothetical protein EKH79_03525 [Dyella dinghuensis]|uniref:Uncharacterized protein n=1 Tax=Dyella dinghuensis TaxID=1920169 RepID=A0A432LWA9_9GAMM|nr:hypothetical protein [Dyella dinghuensis]RUL65795.1 hypothetical protein EKH79_03525 [Dyella dinghuensis]
MWKLKLGAISVIAAVTLVWTVMDVWHGLWWQALATVSAGTIVTLRSLRIGEGDVPWVYVVAIAAFGLGGMGHFFFESPLTNGNRQQALLSLTGSFMTVSTTMGLPKAAQDEAMAGVIACSMEPNKDALTTTTDAMKAVYETPGMSMADRAIGPRNPPSPEECINAYRQTRAMLPWAFREAEKDNPWLLAQL